MLIGGDDISNGCITLGTCFSMFVYIRPHFRFTLISGNVTAQLTQRTGELEVEFKFQRRSCKVLSSASFSRLTIRAPQRACSPATME